MLLLRPGKSKIKGSGRGRPLHATHSTRKETKKAALISERGLYLLLNRTYSIVCSSVPLVL